MMTRNRRFQERLAVIVALTVAACVIVIAVVGEGSAQHPNDREILIRQTLYSLATTPQDQGLLRCIHPVMEKSGRTIPEHWLADGQSFRGTAECRTIVRLHEPHFEGANASLLFNLDCGAVCGSTEYLSYYRRDGRWHVYGRFISAIG